MGIDARMLVRNVPRSRVTSDWLKETSWRLCNSIGAEKFFFAPDKGETAIEISSRRYHEEGEAEPGTCYYQDGDDIVAENGECLLEVKLWTRYFGEGYERGDLLTLCAVAEWLEQNIKGCEVWYGGDSSGVCAEPWPDSKRNALRRHLFSQEGRDYFDHRGMRQAALSPPACPVCPGDTYRGSQCMWGGGPNNNTTAGYHCRGCGKDVETRDGGETWQECKHD